MPTPEESKRIFRQLFGRDPKGAEVADPSAAWIDSLATSKERIAKGKGTGVDSARVFMGKKPEEAPKDSEILREYIAQRKLQIAGGATPSKTDMTLGIVRKPDKLAETEGPLQAADRLMKDIETQDTRMEKTADPTVFDIAEKIKTVKTDSLEMAQSLIDQGYPDFNYMIGLLSKIEVPFEEFLRMRQDPAVDSDPVARHTKALGWIMQETGLSIERLQEILDATGKSEELAKEKWLELKGEE